MPPLPIVLFFLLLALPTSAAAHTLRLVTEDFPPLFSQSLPDNGWAWEVGRTALASQEVNATLEYIPWKRALHESAVGAADGLYGAAMTPERQRQYIFSKPFAVIRIGFFRHVESDITFDGDFQSLRPYVIGMGAGYALHPEFDNADYLQKDESVNSVAALKKLYLRRIDLVIGIEAVDGFHLHNELSRHHPDITETILFMEPPINASLLYLAVSRTLPNAQAIADSFSAGMQAIIENGDFDAILAKHNVPPGISAAIKAQYVHH